MSDIRLGTDTHDIELQNGSIVLVEDDEAVAQKLKIRLQTFWQEWIYDTRVGIPYFRYVLVQNPDIELLRTIYRDTIITTPGIESLQGLSLRLDKAERKLYMNFRATLDSGTELVFEPFILEF